MPTALVGFDAFVDTLYRVVRDHAGGRRNPYPDIPGFAQALLGRAGMSGGFELSRQDVRPGGNAPLMAAGLGALGVRTTCVAPFGLPGLDPCFAPLKAACTLVSVGNPALTYALEFDDGKIMLNDARAFEGLDWAALLQAAGQEKLARLAKDCDLLALVDWANLPKATDLWRGMLGLLGEAGGGRGKKIFVDLADISRAGAGEMAELMDLLRAFQAHGEVALGLNENEARRLAEKLALGEGAGSGPEAVAGLARALRRACGLDLVLIHPRDGACVADAETARVVPGRLVEKPVLSTGGGDHFNAGFCAGWLRGLPLDAAASLGVRAASLYVEGGKSPNAEDLARA